MKARPILFSAPMVRALLNGRKTQTRRVVKPQPTVLQEHIGFECVTGRAIFGAVLSRVGMVTEVSDEWLVPNPYGQPGDLLWVRESWGRYRAFGSDAQPDAPVIYRADEDHCGQFPCHVDGKPVLVNAREPWKPSIHMPRSASRLTLEITGVRVERLQAISEGDAVAEGVAAYTDLCTNSCKPFEVSATRAFCNLWSKINGHDQILRGPGAWDANPWVWVLEFKVHCCNVDEPLKRRDA